MNQPEDEAVSELLRAYQAEQWQQVCQRCQSLLAQGIQRPDVRTLHGLALGRLGQLAEAESAYLSAIACDADYIDAYNNLGRLLWQQKRLGEAAHFYRVAIGKQPRRLELWIMLSNLLNDMGEYDQAVHVGQHALGLDANNPAIYTNLGNTFNATGDTERALQCYAKAQQISPGFALAAYNQALVLTRLGRVDEAIGVLRGLVSHHPEHLFAHVKLGDLLKQTGDDHEAIEMYRRALELNPGFGEIHNNLGTIYTKHSRWNEALRSYRLAVECGQSNPTVYQNLGNAYHALRQFESAIESYRRGLALAPNDVSLLPQLIHVQQKLCDWQGLDHLRERMLLPALSSTEDGLFPPPFNFLGAPLEITPAEHLVIAQRYAKNLQSVAQQRFQHPRPSAGAKQLKVGYVSADFHNHATAHLMLGLFRRHDREKVHVVAYSMSADDGSSYRKRIREDCDQFFDILTYSDVEAAQKIFSDGIDILIDLKGYTGDARPGIFAYRPAPIQVAYLGYPGTMGADFIDYVLADRTVLPTEHIPYYSEKPAYLPHCYQVNDIDQSIAAETPTRAECGLPDNGIVFCCFNAAFKIEPQVFALWMQILQAVPGSVLWLLGHQAVMVRNLRQETGKYGVDPERLVFAEYLPKAQHLARLQLADLFLDTYFYNAHTTASDALWTGVPVLTRIGNYFPSRVAASLLKAVGLDELIVTDSQAYVDLAIQLASSPERLQHLRTKLQQHRTTWPLFDTARFARALERIYLAMWQRWADGLLPAVIEVVDGP